MKVAVYEAATGSQSGSPPGHFEASPPPAPRKEPVFTADDLAGLGSVKPEQARAILADFARRGVVEAVEDGATYRLTTRGARLAHDLAGALEERA